MSSMKSVLVTRDELRKLNSQKAFLGIAVGWSGIVANIIISACCALKLAPISVTSVYYLLYQISVFSPTPAKKEYCLNQDGQD
jgi:hypothetical protein